MKPIVIAWILGLFSETNAGIILPAKSRNAEPCDYRVVFYNTENLFDIYDDPATNDDEFTPEGAKKWTHYRYHEKLNNLAKTLLAMGGWEPPAVVGLCEVENYQVLLDLINETPLKNRGYRIILEEGKDPRGIDVALLYRPDIVNILSHKSIQLYLADFKSRDILYTKALFASGDTLDLFVNHWPSRYGGEQQTAYKRKIAARTLRLSIDSLLQKNMHANVLAMGDFNDEPEDASLSEFFDKKENYNQSPMFNLSEKRLSRQAGTIVHKNVINTWYLFDQMLASKALINGVSGLMVADKKCHIFHESWLLKNDRPYRTYQGPIYIGGFSDHLPIFIDLCRVKK